MFHVNNKQQVIQKSVNLVDEDTRRKVGSLGGEYKGLKGVLIFFAGY